MIDVIFCILTFFILAALQLTRQEAVNVDLPKASTGTTRTQDTLVVSINSTGQTFINKQFVDRNQLGQAFQDYFQKNPNGRLVLYASQTAFYNDVVQVLDLMRQFGGDRLPLRPYLFSPISRLVLRLLQPSAQPLTHSIRLALQHPHPRLILVSIKFHPLRNKALVVLVALTQYPVRHQRQKPILIKIPGRTLYVMSYREFLIISFKEMDDRP